MNRRYIFLSFLTIGAIIAVISVGQLAVQTARKPIPKMPDHFQPHAIKSDGDKVVESVVLGGTVDVQYYVKDTDRYVRPLGYKAQ